MLKAIESNHYFSALFKDTLADIGLSFSDKLGSSIPLNELSHSGPVV